MLNPKPECKRRDANRPEARQDSFRESPHQNLCSHYFQMDVEICGARSLEPQSALLWLKYADIVNNTTSEAPTSEAPDRISSKC